MTFSYFQAVNLLWSLVMAVHLQRRSICPPFDGENGFTLYGPGVVENAGDINGDGFPDLIVGRAGFISSTGPTAALPMLCSERADGFPARVDVFALNGQNGFTLNGGTAYDYAGLLRQRRWRHQW
jgi:hypothetical protein